MAPAGPGGAGGGSPRTGLGRRGGHRHAGGLHHHARARAGNCGTPLPGCLERRSRRDSPSACWGFRTTLRGGGAPRGRRHHSPGGRRDRALRSAGRLRPCAPRCAARLGRGVAARPRPRRAPRCRGSGAPGSALRNLGPEPPPKRSARPRRLQRGGSSDRSARLTRPVARAHSARCWRAFSPSRFGTPALVRRVRRYSTLFTRVVRGQSRRAAASA